MARQEILVVEDEEDILEVLRYNLLKEGFAVRSAASGEVALQRVREKLPDLVLLDLMLPGVDGLEVCRRLRADARARHLPIVMLTAKAEDADMITGLEVGADDYLPKPFSPKVLIARLRAVLRRPARSGEDEGAPLKVHELSIDPARHEVRLRDKLVQLTFTEFRLLHLLARRPGIVLSRERILEAMHGDAHIITDRSVDVQIVGLRRKLGTAGKYIETVRGVGYRLKD